MSIQLGMRWLTVLPGFRVRVKPVSERMRREGATAFRAAKAEAEADGESEADAENTANAAYNRQIALSGIVDWQSFDPMKPDVVLPLDILDPSGNPAEVTPENILMLMDYAPAYQAIEEGYIFPFLKDLALKNVSSLSSNGSSSPAEAKTTAEAA